jgi:hypothetical protein
MFGVWVPLFLIAGLAGWIALPDMRAGVFGENAIRAVIVGAVLLLPLMIGFGLISWCTTTFVVLIMYSTGKKVLEAWREFRELILPGNVGSLILFLLMSILLRIVVIIASMIIGCGTCCLGFLPYLSSVATLPLSIFMQSYAIYFLQQFGPRYVIIQEPPPSYAFPMPGTVAPPPGPPEMQPPGYSP